MDTRSRTPLISFCTVQLRTLCAAHSLATLCLFTTSGPDPEELPGFWGSMVFCHAPIPRKRSGKQQQQQQQLACKKIKIALVGQTLQRNKNFSKNTALSIKILTLEFLHLTSRVCNFVFIAIYVSSHYQKKKCDLGFKSI